MVLPFEHAPNAEPSIHAVQALEVQQRSRCVQGAILSDEARSQPEAGGPLARLRHSFMNPVVGEYSAGPDPSEHKSTDVKNKAPAINRDMSYLCVL